MAVTVDPSPSATDVANAAAAKAVREHARRVVELRDLGYEAFEALDALHVQAAMAGLTTAPTQAALAQWEEDCDNCAANRLWEGDETADDAEARAWVGAALDVLADAELALERARRRARALVARAERVLRAYRRQLLPAVEAWAETHRPRKGKTIRFEATDRHLQWRRDRAARLEVPQAEFQRARVVEWLAERIGYQAALDRGLVRVREHVDASLLRDVVEASRTESVDEETGEVRVIHNIPPGCRFEERKERLGIRGVGR